MTDNPVCVTGCGCCRNLRKVAAERDELKALLAAVQADYETCKDAALEDVPNGWRDIDSAPHNGKETWLGWKPFPNGEGVVPRRGCWDIGSRQWIVHWEDRGSPDGHTPIPFDPQPDYFCEGFTPVPPLDPLATTTRPAKETDTMKEITEKIWVEPDLSPTIRLRWVDKATNNVSVKMVLQQFWANPVGCETAGLWRDIPTHQTYDEVDQ